jgi:hypothetical protein
MTAKDQWIKETMESIEGIQPANANPFLFEKVLNRLQRPAKSISFQLAWKAAAIIILLAVINFFTCIRYAEKGKSTFSNNPFSYEYFNYMNNLQF